MLKTDYERNETIAYLCSYPFTHFITFNFTNDTVLYNTALHNLKGWLFKQVIKKEKLQIAYIGVFNTLPNPHIHLLVLATNRNGKTLHDVTGESWKRRGAKWPGTVDVKAIYDQSDVSGYIVDKNMPRSGYDLIGPYNQRLLHQTKLSLAA